MEKLNCPFTMKELEVLSVSWATNKFVKKFLGIAPNLKMLILDEDDVEFDLDFHPNILTVELSSYKEAKLLNVLRKETVVVDSQGRYVLNPFKD